MKIVTLEHAVPSRRLTNDYWSDWLVANLNGQLSHEDKGRMMRKLQRFLEECGTEIRYTREEGKRSLDYLLQASQDALSNSGVARDEIDFVIYCGVGRGWIEPAMANIVQAELGLTNATCFDILDACASWLRAMQVAHTFIRSKVYRSGLIVNCECSLTDYLHSDFASVEDFDRRLASFTIGEAATATIVNDDNEDDDFYYSFKTFGEHYDLCMIPLANATNYLPQESLDSHIPFKFFAHSTELVSTTVKKIVAEFTRDPNLSADGCDVVFSHAASERASQLVLRRLGIDPGLYFGTHAQYGNTVSASVPLAMSLAAKQQRLSRGDRVLVVVGSAGVSVGFSTFTY